MECSSLQNNANGNVVSRTTPGMESEPLRKSVKGIAMCSISGSNGTVIRQTKGDIKMVCGAHPGCLKTFSSPREYEDHYDQRHRHKCVICKKSLPSAHILEMHVLEAHDTLFSLMAERKAMLVCFLESCSTTFWKCEERKDHCLSEHGFPKSFTLWDLTVNFGTNKKENDILKEKTQVGSEKNNNNENLMKTDDSSLLSLDVSSTAMEVDPTDTMGKQAQEISSKSKQLVPDNSKNHQKTHHAPITFGQSAPRAFKSKVSFGVTNHLAHKDATKKSYKMDLNDIKNVLPNVITKTTSMP